MCGDGVREPSAFAVSEKDRRKAAAWRSIVGAIVPRCVEEEAPILGHELRCQFVERPAPDAFIGPPLASGQLNGAHLQTDAKRAHFVLVVVVVVVQVSE